MGSRFINGAKYAVSTVLGAAVPITGITNADPGVASTATPPAVGDVCVLKSGWSQLTNSVARALGPTANAFSLEGVDTTSIAQYPAGEGVGAYQVASGFVSLSQVRDFDATGGDQQFYNYQYVEDETSQQRQDPTFKNPMSYKIMLDYDSTLPWYQTLIDIDRKRQPIVLRETLPAGDVIYRFGYLSFNKEPTGKVNEHMQVVATFSPMSESTRYDS